MSFYFIKAGLQTSIQDLGRHGLMHLGISNSGVMDSNAIKLANWLLSKPLDSAVIEISLTGPKIRFESNTTIAICGANFDLLLNGESVANDETINLKKDDILQFKNLIQGARAYLAFAGDLQLTPILNSYSTHLTAKFGGRNGQQLNDSDRLDIINSTHLPYKSIPNKYRMTYSGNYLLRCTPSVETDLFSLKHSNQFFSQKYKVTPQSNRMGIKLSGNPIKFEHNIEIVSSGLTQGSIQIPPSGLPILSSVDGQTIGGYPRIANIITIDLPLLAQIKAGDQLNFTLVDQLFAEKAFSERQIYQKELLNFPS